MTEIGKPGLVRRSECQGFFPPQVYFEHATTDDPVQPETKHAPSSCKKMTSLPRALMRFSHESKTDVHNFAVLKLHGFQGSRPPRRSHRGAARALPSFRVFPTITSLDECRVI